MNRFPLDRRVPCHSLLGLPDLLIDPAQGPMGTVVPVLVIDHLIAAATGRPGRQGWVKIC